MTYEKGLDRYYGLVELGVETGLFKKVSNRVELPTGEKIFAKVIYAEPGKYFTDEIMEELEKIAKEKFCYGIESESASTKKETQEELAEAIALIENEVE